MSLDIRAENAPLKVGDEFLKFEIRALLGHGDHAYVYEAFDPMLGRTVAIKIIPDPPNSRRDLVQRSLEQGPILRDLNHPNLVSVYDVGTFGNDLVYIVMELLSGQSLRELLIERHTLTVPEVLSIGIQVAEGMAWAHALQVLHRDLKPENVFITVPPGIKVINTGITSFIVPSGMTTEWDCVRGTLLYMSPEHLQGFGVTGRSDIFSLGTLLYECLAGVPPALVGDEPTSLDDIAWRQISEMPPLLCSLVPEVPEIAARLIQQMLAKEAALRFETMDAVAASLREVYRRVVPETCDKPDEQRPLVKFPSAALGMKTALPREKLPSSDAVVAGAERLLNATNQDTDEQARMSAQDSTPRSSALARKRLYVGLLLGLVALASGLVLHSVMQHRTESTDAAAAHAGARVNVDDAKPTGNPSIAPAKPAAIPLVRGASSGQTSAEASPSGSENQVNTMSSSAGPGGANASAAKPPLPVLKRATRPGRQRDGAGTAGPSESLVF